ncbi:DnaA regulatory inactivator Hda [Advenella sp. S44]|uniref:DnaA regulatory inactivator Hda n=1 Tax=Advenella sp. S44 TaxID=1982755 RepID=UPI000C2A63CD|nr:DnaA regulatory inactivator Hda [Advenella sp. S44]PJX26021.1 DnaA regulatory inactivator Hda [Advenella sp. S44]
MKEQLILDVLPVVSPRFDNFVTGRNDEAVSRLRAAAAGQSIYLWGEHGSGKTHLLLAATKQRGRYLNAATDPLPDPGEPVPAGLLIAVDDVQNLSEAQAAALFGLFNQWKTRQDTPDAFTLLTSGPCAPRQLHIREDLLTRLSWDLVYRLETLTDDERRSALLQRASDKGIPLSAEVTNWMFNYYARDMSALSSLLDALDRYSLAEKRSITVPLLKSYLQSRHS